MLQSRASFHYCDFHGTWTASQHTNSSPHYTKLFATFSPLMAQKYIADLFIIH